MNNSYKIFIILEEAQGQISASSLELLAAARAIVKQITDAAPEVCALYLSDSEISKENSSQLFAKGADIVYSITNSKLKTFNGKYYAAAIYELIALKQPKIVLFSATKSGRELAPQVSTKFNTGLTADCTSLQIADNKLVSIRPTFGGKLMAEILCKTYPQMATLRPGAVKQLDYIYATKGKVESYFPNLENIHSSQKIVEIIKSESAVSGSNLTTAQIVLTGGLGLKSENNFKKLQKIVQAFNSPNIAMGATRGAVEEGLAPKYMQIGQTGISVAPKLYITFGVSGAIHHLIGVENAQTIIAVNNDENAPIFSACDYKIKADAVKLIDDILLHFTS